MNAMMGHQNGINKKTAGLILLFSVVINAMAFLEVICKTPPVWYTNDDYRMMTIVSGAYTGTPSADIVFMRYPIGWMLVCLYSLMPGIAWYGLFTMACMYIPSCIFCYYLIKKAYLKHMPLVGAVLYGLLFLLFIRKYICLPQFTLTSAFMGIGAIVIIHEMPPKKNIGHIMLAVFCCVVSFSVRSKAFYLLLPLLGLVAVLRLLNEKGTKLWKTFAVVGIVTALLCSTVAVVDYTVWNSSEEMRYFKRFTTARSQVYDYGGVPGYYEHRTFYLENDISEVSYRALSARYLDIDDHVDAETLERIAAYNEELRTSKSIWSRLEDAVKETIEYWVDSGDEIVKYSAICVFIMLGVILVLAAKSLNIHLLFPAAVAGVLLETIYLKFSGRLVVRVLDMLLVALGVVGCFAILDLLLPRTKSMRNYAAALRQNISRAVGIGLVALTVTAVAMAGFICQDTALKDKYRSATQTQNSRLDGLKAYAALYPDSFFFYESADFISCTDYVFVTYEEGQILNHDSLGSWNVCSPTYYRRNAAFHFTTAADAFASTDTNVYFVSTSSPKMGITKTLKDRHNKKLRLVDTMESDNYILYVYMVIDDD